MWTSCLWTAVKRFKCSRDAYNFAAKQLLSDADTESDYLVYNTVSPIQTYVTTGCVDIELCTARIHRAVCFPSGCKELHMPESVALRRAISNTYTKFFENKERAAKLAA